MQKMLWYLQILANCFLLLILAIQASLRSQTLDHLLKTDQPVDWIAILCILFKHKSMLFKLFKLLACTLLPKAIFFTNF